MTYSLVTILMAVGIGMPQTDAGENNFDIKQV
jgi:hypothetical protein